VSGIDVVDLTDERDIRCAVARASAQRGRDHPLQAGPEVLEPEGTGFQGIRSSRRHLVPASGETLRSRQFQPPGRGR
jgi:hypothetical protein